MKQSCRIIFALLIFLFLAHSTFGAENDTITSTPGELALLSGYGTSMVGYGETRTQVQTFDVILRYGHFLSGEVGKGTWYQGRHELFLELPYHLALDYDYKSMVGGTILGSWKFTWADQFTPYLYWGGGLVYVDLGIPTMGRKLNGTYQFGGGIQHFIDKNLAINGEYRFHHISNLNTASPNEPLNSSKLLIGITYFR
jgi:hypothetical protein